MSIAVRAIVKPGTVLEAMAKLGLDPSDKRDLMDQIGFGLSENTRLRFSDGVTPAGDPWVPSLRAKLQGGETMRDTGVLMNSITHLVGADFVEVGSNVPYGPWLHFGATIRPTNGQYLTFKVPGGGWARKTEVTLPARPWLGISEDDETEITDIIAAFLTI